jgi:hypothetical protein
MPQHKESGGIKKSKSDMNDPKAFYRTYLADDTVGELNRKLVYAIMEEAPTSVFEFGCGTSKNLKLLPSNVVTCGMDVSPANIICSHYRNDRTFAIIGDEYHLAHLHNFDVAFTCSVLDHIELIGKIVAKLKSIAPVVILAETNDVVGKFYYPHNYEEFGFEKMLNFSWVGNDGATYFIWKWKKYPRANTPNDDLGK